MSKPVAFMLTALSFFISGCGSGQNTVLPKQSYDCSTIDKRKITLPDPYPDKKDYQLSLSANYDLLRDGAINSEVVYHIEVDGTAVIGVNGKGNLNYRYFNLYYYRNKNFKAWLEKFDKQIVSNILEFTPTFMEDLYILKLGQDKTITSSTPLASDTSWILNKNGINILETTTQSNIYRIDNLDPGQLHRVWLKKKLYDGSEKIVSNIITIDADEPCTYPFTISVDDKSYSIDRTGAHGDNLSWVIQQDGEIVLERGAASELAYTYFGNKSGSYYRVWLKSFGDSRYVKVSNTIEYSIP